MCGRVRKQKKKDVGVHDVDCSSWILSIPVVSCLFNHLSRLSPVWNHEVAALGSEEVAKIEEGFNRLSVRGESPGGISWKSFAEDNTFNTRKTSNFSYFSSKSSSGLADLESNSISVESTGKKLFVFLYYVLWTWAHFICSHMWLLKWVSILQHTFSAHSEVPNWGSDLLNSARAFSTALGQCQRRDDDAGSKWIQQFMVFECFWLVMIVLFWISILIESGLLILLFWSISVSMHRLWQKRSSTASIPILQGLWMHLCQNTERD